MRIIAALAFASLAASACARTITVKAGEDFELVCLKEVEAGDTCYLEKGDYEHDGLTVTHGTADKRITITGDKDACIKGSNSQDRVLQIAHDYYTIEGICFDGDHGGDGHVATAIYVLGADRKSTKNGLTSSVTGLQMFNLEIKNFYSECVHFRYFVTHSEVQGCTIQHCGIEAFESGGGGKVGEGIYVGTALDQVKDGKAPEPKIRSGSADNVDADVCRDNWIHHNTFRTYGNECVDVKEGSTNNLIEHNVCEQQKDPNSGGFGLRGSENTVRYNEISECVGAGIRVGGDKDFGGGNNLYGNKIKNTDYGSFNVMSPDQGMVCENEASGSTLAVGAYKSEFVSAAVLGDCDSYPGDLDGFSSPSPSPDSSESDDATPAPEEQTTTSQAGVNFALSRESSVDEIYNVETNEAGGSSGLGECATVLEVEKVKVEHAEDADDTTSVDNLFDSDMKSYFSVNRESTTLTFELKEETDVNGISIGFFMKLAAEKRIQTFDIAVRGADDEDWTTVISRKESSGSMEDVQHFPFPSYTVLYVRFESHGNTFNNWTALTEVEICGEAAQESNALFGGVKAVNKELQMLAGEVCPESAKLSPVTVRANGRDNLSTVFDGNFETRWSTFNTANEDDLDNDKIIIRFLGDQRVSKVKIAFFDGHLARPHFSLYTQSAAAWSWTPVLESHIADKEEAFQTFSIEASGVNQLYIVGNGNDRGDYTKISEIEIWGC